MTRGGRGESLKVPEPVGWEGWALCGERRLEAGKVPTPGTLHAAQALPVQGGTAAGGVDVGATNHLLITENTGPWPVWLRGLEHHQLSGRW